MTAEAVAAAGRTDWLRVVCLWLAGVGAGLQFAKVSVLFDALAARYALGPTGAGWLVSAVGVVGVVFGASAGLVVARVGAKRALVGALTAATAISLYQASAPPFAAFLASRVLEGAAHLAIVVAAPGAIGHVAGPQGRAMALGLWGAFMSVAFLLAASAAPAIVARFGLDAVFLVHAGWMAALAAAIALAFPAGALPAPTPIRASPAAILRAHGEIYADPRTAGPAFAFLCYTGMYLALQTLTPALAPPESRHFVLVGMPVVSLVATLIAGLIAQRWMSPFRLAALSFAAVVAASAILHLAVAAGGGVAPLALARMAFVSLLPGAIFPMVPLLAANPTSQARAYGAIAQTGNVGSALGPPLFGAAMAALGPIGLFVPAAALCGCGIGLTLWLGRRFAAR